jgi:mRNA deadenylase 3'-5' endonuclease subunit Ccr4
MCTSSYNIKMGLCCYNNYLQHACVINMVAHILKSKQFKMKCSVRGINSQAKLTAIRSKILETNSEIICLQETKRENFNQNFIKHFCPSAFDCFEFIPSVGASGGMINIWYSSRFNGK